MNLISIRDFWCNYSKKQIELKHIDELPCALSLRVLLDIYFGKLARHRFEILDHNEIKIECLDCPYALDEKNDVCETHIGIVQGQICKIFSQQFEVHKTIEQDVCVLKFRKQYNEK